MPIIAAYFSILLIWSTTPLAIQWSTTEVGFLFGVTSRMLIGTLICILILVIKKQRLPWTRESIIVYSSAASGIYGSMLFVYWGALYVPSGMIAVVFGLSPIITLLLARILLNEPAASFRQLAGLIMALSGLVVTSQTSLAGFKYFSLGLVLILISVSLHSLSSVLTKRYNKQHSALVVTTGGLIFASTLLTGTWFIFDGALPGTFPLHTVWSIVYLGVIATGIGFILYFYVLSHISPVKLALLTLITPVTAISIGILFNGEKLTLEIVIGTLLIMTGLILNLIKKKELSTDQQEDIITRAKTLTQET